MNHGRGLLLSVVVILAVSDGAAGHSAARDRDRPLAQAEAARDRCGRRVSKLVRGQRGRHSARVRVRLALATGGARRLDLHPAETRFKYDGRRRPWITTFGHLVNERKYVPAIAIAGEVKVPTTQNNLIGIGEVDVTPFLIASKRFRRC